MPRRPTLSLDGFWQFRHGDGPWRAAQVPLPWQAQFADLRQTSGTGHYQRSFAMPDLGPGQLAVLRFGAVSYHATVRVNGVQVGLHEGGYLPFECPLPPDLLQDDNLLEVTALLPDGDAAATPDFPFAEVPHGKQSWYGPIGGIWQSVSLQVRPQSHLQHCAIRATLDGSVAVTLALNGSGEARVTILDPQGREVAQGTGLDLRLKVAEVAQWSPNQPALYQARVEVTVGDIVDETTHTFGFRSFESKGGKLFLNGAPFYMRGALDQDYYPETICTPPSVAYLEDQLLKAKALGLNLLRCHIKVPDPRYYEVADRLGMLIWSEIPNVGTFTAASARRMQETMQGILDRDANHPCLVIWTLINEDWGTKLTEDAGQRAWLKGMYDWLKAADPTRLVVDNSPCKPGFHVKTDLNDYHYYRSVPERRSEWDQLTAEFAAGADWAWSPYGDADRRGDEPLIVSEFGVWGLPDPALLVDSTGAEPWWMETGSVWGDGVAYPHGVQDRFATYQLAHAFGSFDAFIQAAQWYQFANLKYEIESMRAAAPIQGYVITEFTDVHWESNGLLDMNRNPRVFHHRFAEINADTVIVPRLDRYSCYAGAAVAIELSVALGGLALAEAAVLHWSVAGGAAGQVPAPASPAQSVVGLGTLQVPMPLTDRSQMVTIAFRLMQGGTELARNAVEVACYAPRNTENLPPVASTDPDLLARLRALGYPIVAPDKADVILCRGLETPDIKALQAGKRYLVLPNGSGKRKNSLRQDHGPMHDLPDIGVTARDGSIWRGDWIAGFSWITRKGAFADIPGGPMIDLSFDRVVPHHVLTGFKSWEFGGLVHAGLVAGWIHKPGALIAERRVGKGALVASTFRLLADAPLADPVATALLDALIRTAADLTVEKH